MHESHWDEFLYCLHWRREAGRRWENPEMKMFDLFCWLGESGGGVTVQGLVGWDKGMTSVGVVPGKVMKFNHLEMFLRSTLNSGDKCRPNDSLPSWTRWLRLVQYTQQKLKTKKIFFLPIFGTKLVKTFIFGMIEDFSFCSLCLKPSLTTFVGEWFKRWD